MKLLFKHKKYNWIVDKDIFKKNNTISFVNFDKNNISKTLTFYLTDILDSDDWDVIVPDYLSYEELHKISHILHNDIAMNGDQYWLSNTLSKINELMYIYDIDGMDILS